MEKTPVNTFQTILRFPQLGSGPANLEAAIPGDPSDYIVRQHGEWVDGDSANQPGDDLCRSWTGPS